MHVAHLDRGRVWGSGKEQDGCRAVQIACRQVFRFRRTGGAIAVRTAIDSHVVRRHADRHLHTCGIMHQDAAQQGKRETKRDEADPVAHAIQINAGLVPVHLVVWNFNHDDMTPVDDETHGEGFGGTGYEPSRIAITASRI